MNFTNPAGLITQAVMQHSGARVVGICDTPTEMLHRIQTALGARVCRGAERLCGAEPSGLGAQNHAAGRGCDGTQLLNDDALSGAAVLDNRCSIMN